MLLEWPVVGPDLFQVSKSVSFGQSPNSSTSAILSPFEPIDQPAFPIELPDPEPRKFLKRSRLAEDIDGGEEINAQRKKRRLRLDLITSRLSKPYATPTTHILGRRAWRVGFWARQSISGGKLLQKAAILNSIAVQKRKREIMKKLETSGLQPTNASFTYSIILH